MLIAGITLLIGILFGGSDLSTFLVEDLPKEIKHNVEDKEKQKQILAVLKEYEKEFKKTQKEINKSTKELKKLNLDRNSTESSIRLEFAVTLDLWKKLQNDGIDKRLQVIGLLTEDEWEKVIANSIADPDKKEKKHKNKIYENFDKEVSKIKKEIEKTILDTAIAVNIENAFKDFSNGVRSYISANMDRTLKNHKTLRNKEANKEELEQALLFVVDARKNVFEQLLKLHFKLIDLTTEDEWKKISKSINELY